MFVPLCACVVALAGVPSPPGQAPPRWEVAFDFLERLSSEGVRNDAGATAANRPAGGAVRPSLFLHPRAAGQPLARVEFLAVALPDVRPGERLALRFATAIADGFDPATMDPRPDGCAFLVEVDGREAFRVEQARQAWEERRIDLTEHAGRTVSVAFATDPLGNSACDWAMFGQPRVEIEGRRAAVKPIPALPLLALDRLLEAPPPSRVVESRSEREGATVIASLEPRLDLAAQLRAHAAIADPATRDAVEIVAGEGEAPENHTLVRVLNRFGIADAQFIAYPPSVRGGVQVRSGRRASGAAFVATAPIASASAREVRLFTRWGAPLSSIRPPAAAGPPPWAIAAGRFVAGQRGDQVAILCRDSAGARRPVLLYSPEGRLLRSVWLPGAGRVVPSRASGGLLCYLPAERRALLVDPSGRVREVLRDAPASARSVTEGADGALLAVGEEPLLSTVTRLRPGQPARVVDVGERENRFYLQWYADGWEALPDGKHVRKSIYRHLRTDYSAPNTPDPARPPEPSGWRSPAMTRAFEPLFRGYGAGLPSVWEPCFTHRWGKGVMDAWARAVDPETKLPRYLLLTRNNRTAEYGEFGTSDFHIGTYAFGLPELERLYVWPLRAFLRRLASVWRPNPDALVAVEPNHEHEIAVDAEGTLGDYNPRMVEGFFHFLAARYGRDPAAINRAMGTPFRTHFDAPRNQDRGAWDAYDQANPFLREWTAYQRHVVNLRLAQTFREALLAGFPPELIKSHQIPDIYAVGRLDAFSSVVGRFTPIDYAMAAGVGYGFTRYGVWYNQPHDALQDAHSAGFDMMLLGEYQALTPSDEHAFGQLRFIQENGGYSVHCMMWPESHDRGFNASMDRAARRLLDEDRPKPNVTGGVGEVRVASRGRERFEIACIGAGPERNGLLKSLRPDGSWEGGVYVTPFRAHVEVKPLAVCGSVRAGRGAVEIGPLNGLDAGMQVEVTFRARGGVAVLEVRRGTTPLPGLRATVDARGGGWRPVRFVLRCPLAVEELRVVALPASRGSRLEVADARATLQSDCLPRLSRGVFSGRRHRGGVTFDVVPASGGAPRGSRGGR